MSVYDLAGMLDSRFKAVRRRAARCLARIEVAEDAVDVAVLARGCRGSDPLVLVQVLTLLERIGPPAFDPAITALLQHPLDLVRHPASRCLAKMGDVAMDSLKKVVLSSADSKLGMRAIVTLVQMVELHRDLVAKIRAVLASVESSDEDLRAAVDAALAKLDQIAG